MIIVTGAAGFIGANTVAALNARGRNDVVAVDFFISPGPAKPLPRDPGYLDAMQTAAHVDATELEGWLFSHGRDVDAVIHLGACSDTTETDRDFIMSVNYEYTRMLWRWCTTEGKPFVYASSAATYGDGSHGYDDRVHPSIYQPLNLYGESKQRFDLWALEQEDTPPRWAGVKYFNVYGPRENHKGRMASVAFHAFHQISRTGKVRLFESHKEGIAHGGQRRDFILVDDAVAITLHLLDTPATSTAPNGLYNAGTGNARTFADLARAVFAAMSVPEKIEFFPMPEDLRGKYQYFTQAHTAKLEASGFTGPTHSLEDGVAKYVKWLEGAG